MKMTRVQLRSLIEDMLFENEVERTSKTSVATAAATPLALVAGINSAKIAKILTSPAEGPANVAKETIKVILAKRAGPFAGPLILFASVFGAFAYLPNLMKKQIKNLNTVEGVLENQRKLLKKPIELTDISEDPRPSIINAKRWSRDMIVDYMASMMEVEEGRALFGKLVASEYTSSTTGARMRGPILGQSFVNAIQLRRRDLHEEAGEKIKNELISKLKAGDVSEENAEKLSKSLEALSKDA